MLAKQPQIEIHLIHTYLINTYLIQSINNVKIKPKLTFTRRSTLNEISRGICFVKSYLVSQGGTPHFQNGGSISFGAHARRLGKPHFPESFGFPGESRSWIGRPGIQVRTRPCSCNRDLKHRRRKRRRRRTAPREDWVENVVHGGKIRELSAGLLWTTDVACK